MNIRLLRPSCLSLILAGALALGTIGCDSEEQTEPADESSETQQDDDTDRQLDGVASSEFAQHLAADAELAMSIGNLGMVRSAPEELLNSPQLADATRQQWEEQWGQMREGIEADIGVDFFDPQLFDEWGVDADGPLFVGSVGLDPVLCASVTDRDDFNQFAVDVMAADWFEVEAPEHEQVEHNDDTIHTVGPGMSWAFIGDSSCVAVQTADVDSSDTLATFLDGPEEGNSLADTDGFQQFADSDVNRGLFTAYSAQSDVFTDLMGPSAAMGPMSMFQNALSGQAAGVTVDNDILSLRGWGGLEDAQLQLIQRSVTPDHSFDWNRFGTDNTTAALRLSLNPEVLWEQFQTMANEQMQAVADDAFDQASAAGDVDAEDEIIGNLSGHIGLFLYDLPEPEALMGGTPPDLEQELQGLLALHFINEQPLDELLTGLDELQEEGAPTSFERRTIGEDADSIDVLAFDNVDVQLYRHDNLLVLATNALGEERVASLIYGEHSDEAISDSGLGAALNDDVFNGLYIGQNAWPLLELEFPDASTHFQEALIRFDATDAGLTFGFDFHPAGSPLFGIAHGFQVDQAQQAGVPDAMEVPEPTAK